MLQKAINHAVALARDKGIGNRADVELFAADARHVQEGVRFVGVAQNRCDAFLFKEIVPFTSRRGEICEGEAGIGSPLRGNGACQSSDVRGGKKALSSFWCA